MLTEQHESRDARRCSAPPHSIGKRGKPARHAAHAAARTLITLVCTGAAATLAPAQTPGQPDAATQPASAVDSLIQLNEGIRAFHRNRDDEALRILEQLRTVDPNNVACLYHLGLLHLRAGLRESEAKAVNAARRWFEQARDYFKTIIESTDPSATPLEAALNFGIAQLGSEDPKRDEEYRRQLNRRAAETLQRYSASDVGRSDAFGHFYLGVAYYRLSSAPGENKATMLRKARDEFRRATALAASEIRPKDPAGYQRFDATATYYQGLIDLTGGGEGEEAGLAKLRKVARDMRGDQLGDNAEVVAKFVEEQRSKAPQPLSLDQTPVGPLRLEGSVNIGQYYDTNVILLGQDTDLPRSIAHKQDYKFGLGAGFNLSRTFEKADGILGQSFTVGVGGSTFHVWQPSIGEFDINDSGRTYLNWEAVKDLFFGIEYDYAYTMLGHQPFISSNRVTPVISKVWRGAATTDAPEGEERSRTDLYYSYDRRNYLDEISGPEFDRDGNYHTVGVTQTINLLKARDIWKSYYGGLAASKPTTAGDGDRWLDAKVGYYYRNERTQGDEFDLYGNSVFFGFDVPLPWRFVFDFTGEYTWDQYTQPSAVDYRRNQRFDFIQRYDMGLTYSWVERGEVATLQSLRMRTRAGVELTFQDSNIWDRTSEDVYSFDRAVYGLQLLIDF